MARTRHNAPAPPLPAGSAVIRFTIFYRANAQILESVIDYLITGLANPSLTDLQTFVTGWRVANETQLLNCLSQDCTVFQYTAGVVSNNTTPTYVLGVNQVGALAVAMLPIEMAAVATKRSALKGQHGRGRIYWPCVPVLFTTAAIDPNLVNAVGQIAYGLLHVALEAGVLIGVNLAELFISTRPVPPAFLVTVGVLVTDLNITALLGTQRRRREGRGK